MIFILSPSKLISADYAAAHSLSPRIWCHIHDGQALKGVHSPLVVKLPHWWSGRSINEVAIIENALKARSAEVLITDQTYTDQGKSYRRKAMTPDE